MLKIEVADFKDEEAFDLDLKPNQEGQKLWGARSNSISIRMTSGSRCFVRRCLDFTSQSAGQETPVRHAKRPRRAYPAVKPCRPCRVGKIAV